MKKQLSLLFALLLGCTTLMGAPKSVVDSLSPDNEAILIATIDADSPLYYPAIFTRYSIGDTTLTLKEYCHLYYGYAWQDTYRPFESPAANLELLSIFEKPQTHLTEGDCIRIIELCNEVMLTEPFNPSTINFLVFAYGALGDTVNERINYHRLQMLIKTIQSSGSGKKENSPWHVLYFSHATEVLGHLELNYGKRMVVSRTTEYIPLLARQMDGTRGYYFNYERVYWTRPDQLPEKPKTNWQFNDVPIRKESIKVKDTK